ncbi:hypothetical protein F444_10876 [Phytophthora nicotianae P1976]|uniref:MULE transposase domain-containing protein n=1 Tax=Phytophthora nicotianae P1976 TaxID=1317066 RepID=A0A081A2P2_PHYNI|nr:hypothetical protein F444_10876 [Phytophthora nicotianae P1976]
MGYDLVFDLYLPILYVLLPDKQQDTYWHLLDNVIMQSDLQVDLRYTTCDFEMGLLNTVRQQFTGFSVVDCLFHCKHALPRKMIDLRIPQEAVSHVMTAGVIDVLTVIPITEIAEKGIPFVRRRVDELGHQVQWDTSWRYFTRTWVRNYDPTPWNIQAISESTDIVNRTNNALERFKRDRDESFTSAHSKLLTLLAVIADGESLCCQDGGHTPQLPAGSRAGKSGWVEIPAEYRQFCEE